MLASLGAALAGKASLIIGGVVALLVAFVTGRVHGAASAKNAADTAQSQAEKENLKAQAAVVQDMATAQINSPKTIKDLADKARRGEL